MAWIKRSALSDIRNKSVVQSHFHPFLPDEIKRKVVCIGNKDVQNSPS